MMRGVAATSDYSGGDAKRAVAHWTCSVLRKGDSVEGEGELLPQKGRKKVWGMVVSGKILACTRES